MTFEVSLSEAAMFGQGWTFQIFIDQDDDEETGYGRGFDKLVRGVELAGPQLVYVRETETGTGPGGWGADVGPAWFSITGERKLKVVVVLADAGIPNGKLRFSVETYFNGILEDYEHDVYTESSEEEIERDCNGNGIPDHVDVATGLGRDCNKNGTPDECDLADATSNDCDESGVPDECENDCNENGIADECDLLDGVSVDGNGNGVPDECEAAKNRYISFVPYLRTPPVAYRVELLSSEHFPDSVGAMWWVDTPNEAGIASLTDLAVFRDWSSDRTLINIGDCAIVPASEYEIRPTFDGRTFFDPIVVATVSLPVGKSWGDVVGERVDSRWEPPDGRVNLNDFVATVATFRHEDGAPPTTWIDIAEEQPDHIVNVVDIQLILLAFLEQPYPFPAPADCP